VQGDERDIILLSVCYGYDRNRRMLMNFGPINQRGGEKRLNVIFSRARQHMAVISSIRHFDITNDYNDGANCLRSFLEYADACSTGDVATARRVLQAANPLAPRSTMGPPGDPVAAQIASALQSQGLFVEANVGQSTFRLPLAVRRESHGAHLLGVLIDDAAHYAQPDLLERYLLRPNVLQAFGWRVVQVFTKDWYQDPESVLRQITDALAGVEPEPNSETPVELVQSPPRETVLHEPVCAEPTVASNPEKPIVAGADSSRAAGVVARPRYFSCTEEGSSKFWEVTVSGAELTVRFGRIGTKGQSQAKTFATPEAALHEQEKLIRSKTSKGYEESFDE
jgi:predicted DNA-binding WGR domain protein